MCGIVAYIGHRRVGPDHMGESAMAQQTTPARIDRSDIHRP